MTEKHRKCSIALFAVLFSIASCSTNKIEISTFDSEERKLECGFYLDYPNTPSRKVLFFTGLDAYCFIFINNEREVVFPNYDSAFSSFCKYYSTDKKYELLLRLKKDTATKLYNGVMIVKNNAGISVEKKIKGKYD